MTVNIKPYEAAMPATAISVRNEAPLVSENAFRDSNESSGRMSATLNVRETPASDGMEVKESSEQRFEKRFVAVPQGFALGMHTWGAERPIDPRSVTVGLEEYASLGRSTLRLYVRGPASEPGHEGRSGYCAGFTLNGFQSEVLPPHQPLADGLRLTSDDGATLAYDAGKLTVTRERKTYLPRFPLPAKETTEVATLVLDVNANLTEVRGGTFTATRSRKKLFGGQREPELVTSVSFGEAVDAKDSAALARAVTDAQKQGADAIEAILRAAFNR
jgi:hypothetical protein